MPPMAVPDVAAVSPAPAAALPVVDMSLPEEQAAAVLKEACEGPGFFYLTGHGVEEELMARVFQQMKALFALPMEEKFKLNQDKNTRGYTKFEEEVLDPSRQKERGDTKEGYYIGNELPADHPRAVLPLHGPNQWPPPELVPEFRPVMEEYWKECERVSMKILRIMGIALGLGPGFFEEPGKFDNYMGFLRPLHYTTEPSKPDNGIFGCGAHSDYGMLTLLAVGGPGLQICQDRTKNPPKWENVEVIKGAYVVNIGDMLERWTNGRWRSTLHRVITPEGTTQDRYSLPYFFEPNFDCLVEVLECCTSPDNPAKWPPTTAGEHLLGMYKQTHMELDNSLKAA